MSSPSSPRTTTNSCLVFGSDDALFGSIEKEQGERDFGNFLDAGTGLHSMRWIATLPEKGLTHFTAVTADKTMQTNVQKEVDDLEISPMGNVIIGNWFGEPPIELKKNSYDTILADYLIGAMDGFSPYKQDLMIGKLLQYLKPGGRLYIVGLEPIPDDAPGDADIICQVRRVRDACILLAGHRCYREYPLEWILRQIRQQYSKELELIDSTRFPILYRHATIVKQINVGRSKIPYFPNPELAGAMKELLNDLEERSREATERSGGRIKLGFDYIVTTEKLTSTREGLSEE
ncbi:hypothetical protein IV203_027375 [Nitzschia inconspicua]|uniref:Uncharacterized protein n=1 Tax=Nitzschia inconspicua TaxID=303405 RepID=A0A9K3Q604_9STRA|nr:hypothetical protein IV203_027375 [Nitzschia inconspicua]